MERTKEKGKGKIRQPQPLLCFFAISSIAICSIALIGAFLFSAPPPAPALPPLSGFGFFASGLTFAFAAKGFGLGVKPIVALGGGLMKVEAGAEKERGAGAVGAD